MKFSKSPVKRGRRFVAVASAVASALATMSALSPSHALADSPASKGGTPIVQTVSNAHTFTYAPPTGNTPSSVFVAGDFNGWSQTATPLAKNDQNGGVVFTADVPLNEGAHQYKFIVDGKWMPDPAADASMNVDDNYGGHNSGLVAGFDARKLPPPQPGAVNPAGVLFDPADARDCNVASPTLLRLSIRSQAGDATSAGAWIRFGSDVEWKRVTLGKISSEAGLDRWAGVVATPAGSTVAYDFELDSGQSAAFVAGGNAFAAADAARSAAYSIEMRPTFQTPEWAKHAVWYQIFPERFRNGDTANDPPNTMRWTSKWYNLQPGEKGDFYANVYNRRYGGDVQGVKQELPYLRSLGITAIYLNPIFQAESLHKYDASDYRHIDEHFGVAGDIEKLKGETEDPATWQWTPSDRVFLDLVAEAHEQGFKVIVDGVFNHTGTAFWAFQDLIKNGKNSKYVDWFDIIDWNPGTNKNGDAIPFHYKAWDGDNGFLPAFKKDDTLGIVHGPREHILSIAKRWLAPDGDASRGVDGFRLDAPENVPHPFWAAFRETVKQTKPDAYIDGEIWSPAQAWLGGDQFDGVMNYQFAMLSQSFFVNVAKAIKPTEMAQRAGGLVMMYPFQSVLVSQNLFDSHDTDRVASMFANPDLAYDSADRIQDNGPHYTPIKPNALQRQRMLQDVAWQMSFVGAPMIYYGDEAGMWSADDPSDRQPMIWRDLGTYDDPQVTFDAQKFAEYQRLIAARRALPALQTGFYRPVVANDAAGTFGFWRDAGNDHALVLINRSPMPRDIKVAVPGSASRWFDYADADSVTVADSGEGRPSATPKPAGRRFTATNGVLNVSVPPWGTRILAPATH